MTEKYVRLYKSENSKEFVFLNSLIVPYGIPSSTTVIC